MQRVRIRVDGRELEAMEGERLLDAALANGVFVPHLCHRDGSGEPFAGCRLCFVEVDGRPGPVTACTERVRGGMVVRTDTGAVRRLQRSALRLLLSAHHIDCRRCVANRRCALQMLARALNVRFKVEGLRDLSRREPQERTLPGVVHDPGKCVLCGRCVRCARESGQGVFQFSHRGLRTRIAMFPTDAPGNAAGACWQECPVGALFPEEG